MLIRTVLLALLATGVVAGQPIPAEIAGRITLDDGQQSALPGVRVTVSNDGGTQHAFTDSTGQFVLQPTALGKHRVVLELAGFRTVSGEVTLSPSVPRAFLGWTMKVGCLAETQTVIFGPRAAAGLVASIVHLRVTAETGPVLVSHYPECPGYQRHRYAVQVLASVGRKAEVGVGRSQILTYNGTVTPGREYVALLWPNAETAPDYLLPVVAGRVVAPTEGELNGKSLHEALGLLQRWSQDKTQ